MTDVTPEYGLKSRAFAYTQETDSDDDCEQSSTDWGEQLCPPQSDEEEDGSFSEASSVTVSDLDGDLGEEEIDDFGSKSMFSLCCGVGVSCLMVVLVGRLVFGEGCVQDFALTLIQPALDWVKVGEEVFGERTYSAVEGVMVWCQAAVDTMFRLLGRKVFQPLCTCSRHVLDFVASVCDLRFSFSASFFELVIFVENFVSSLRVNGLWCLRVVYECVAVIFGVVKVWADQVLECMCALYEVVHVSMRENADSCC